MSQNQQGLRDTSERQQSPVPPLAPAQPSSDRWAWALAVMPLAAAILWAPLALAGLNRNWLTLIVLLACAGLVLVDKRDLVRTGRVAQSSLPSTAWFLVSPVYLFKRVKRLNGPKAQFWVSIACSVLASIVSIAVAVTVATSLADTDPVLPGCADRGSMADVISVFDDMEGVRSAGLHGVIVTDQTETGQGPGARPAQRFCSGTMHASNERDYDMQYAFEIVQGQVIIHVQLQ